jgi:DNA-binding CsgD family transcriptional regulator
MSAGSRHVATARLLEREHELAQLRALVDQICAGDSRIAILEAPAGIGKTRLIEAIRADAAKRGARVLTARGSERERTYPFGVVRQLLEPSLVGASEERRRTLFSGAASLAEPIFDRRPDIELPADAGYATLHGLYWLLVAVADGEPVVVTIDDMHWADAPSGRFLSFLVRRLEGLRVAMLVATRPQEHATEDGLLDELARDPRVDSINPGPLSEHAVAELVTEALRQQPDEAFSRACWEATGGNPFFLKALLGELRGDGVAPTEAEVARVRELGPEAVLRSTLVRLAALPSGALALAQAVAVLGDGAAVHQAAELAALEVSTAIDAAQALVRIGIFSDSERLTLAHPIVRTALYRDLTASRRAQRHAQAARLLADAGASQDEIAAHLLLVAPGADPAALRTLRHAAGLALARGAPEVAAAYLNRALAEPCDPPNKMEVLVELGTAEALAGLPDCVAHLSSALQQAGEPSHRVTAAVTLARVLAASNRASEGVALLSELADELAEPEPDLAGAVEAELLSLGDIELSVRRVTEPRGVRSHDMRGHGIETSPVMLVHQAVEASLAGTSAIQAAELATKALSNGALLADALAGGQLFFLAASLLVCAEAYEQAASFLDQALADAVSKGSALGFIGASAGRSLLNTRRGALAEAEADARAAVDAAQLNHWPMWRLQAGTMLAGALLERGEARSADVELDGLESEAGFATATQGVQLLETRGRVRLELGKTEAGVADLLESGQQFERWGLRNPAAFAWRSNAGLGLMALAQPARAAALAAEEVALARRWGSPRALGVALRAQGLINGPEREVALLTEAVAELDRSGALVERARALTDLGAALRRAKQRTDAREPLRVALQLAHDCGAVSLAERAHTELAASGARPRTPLRSGVDALSPSELRIARMAASAQANPAIAQALFITVKTVEMHLTSTYRKLNIASRRELTDALERKPGELAGA